MSSRHAEGEQFTPEFRTCNAGTSTVPRTDDGSYLSESVAICRYFEEIQPDPPLFGRTPQKAEIEMWNRRVELNFSISTGMCFQHATPFQTVQAPGAGVGEAERARPRHF